MRGSLTGMENSIQNIGKLMASAFQGGTSTVGAMVEFGGEKRITPVNSVLP